MDPSRLERPATGSLTGLVFETLLTIGPTGRLLPGLAEEWKQSDDGKTLQLKLVPALFSDGERISAAAVISSLARLESGPQKWLVQNLKLKKMLFSSEGPLFELFSAIEPGDGDLDLGRGASTEPTAQAPELPPPVAGWLDLKLTLHLENPDPLLLFKLAHPATAIVRTDAQSRLLGTGPFILKRVRSNRTVLIPNPLHRLGRPFLDKVEIQSFKTLDEAFRELEKKALDLAPVPLSEIDWLADGSRDLKLYTMENRETVLLLLNHKRHPSLRKAWVAKQLDFDSMITYRLWGHGKRAQTFEPRLTFYGQPSPAQSDGGPPPELEGPLKLLCPLQRHLAMQLAERIRRDLSEKGVRIQIDLQNETAICRKTAEGDFDMALFFVRSYGAPALTLMDWQANLSKSPSSISSSLASWLEADEKLRALPGLLPLFATVVYYAADSRLTGLQWTAGGRPMLEQAWWSPLLDIKNGQRQVLPLED